VGIAQGTPTANLHIGAGSTTQPPLKLTSGSLTTTPETGAIEYLNDILYFSNTEGRHQIWGGDLNRQTDDPTFVSNTTYQNLGNMTVSFSAGSLYEIEIYGRLTAGAGGAKLRIVNSGGTYTRIDLNTQYTVNGAASSVVLTTGGGTFAANEFASNTTGVAIYQIKGILEVATDATIWVQGAANSVNAATTQFWRNSFIKITNLS
jgi:hypothetical protein